MVNLYFFLSAIIFVISVWGLAKGEYLAWSKNVSVKTIEGKRNGEVVLLYTPSVEEQRAAKNQLIELPKIHSNEETGLSLTQD